MGIWVFGLWGGDLILLRVILLLFGLSNNIQAEKVVRRTIAVMFFMMISGFIVTALPLQPGYWDPTRRSDGLCFSSVAGLHLLLAGLV